MNWTNVNLTDPYERDQNLLDPYDFDTLLLEISTNIREITPETVKAQALLSIKSKYETALEILENNLQNITEQAQRERAEPWPPHKQQRQTPHRTQSVSEDRWMRETGSIPVIHKTK